MAGTFRTLLLAACHLAPRGALAEPPGADAEARKVLDETCSAIASPTPPGEAALENELVTMLWASRIGAKLTGTSDVQAVGQMLRDLAASRYDWGRLDAATQLAEFRAKWAPAYKLSDVVTEGIAKLAADHRAPIFSALLVLPCRGQREPELQRQTLGIRWVQQKRPDRRTVASARIPGATLTFVEFLNGFQNVAFQFDTGTICFGSAQALQQMFMICGTHGARYELSRKAGEKSFVLEWVTERPR